MLTVDQYEYIRIAHRVYDKGRDFGLFTCVGPGNNKSMSYLFTITKVKM